MTSTKLLICVLAIIDLITGVVTIPLHAVNNWFYFDVQNIYLCKVISAWTMISITPGPYLLLGLSVIRYFRVCKPQKLYVIEKNTEVFCVFVFLITVVSTVITVIINGRQAWSKDDQDLPLYYCFRDDKYRNTLLHIIFQVFTAFGYLVCTILVTGLNFFTVKEMLQSNPLRATKSMRTKLNVRSQITEDSNTESHRNTFSESLKQAHETLEEITNTISHVHVDEGPTGKKEMVEYHEINDLKNARKISRKKSHVEKVWRRANSKISQKHGVEETLSDKSTISSTLSDNKKTSEMTKKKSYETIKQMHVPVVDDSKEGSETKPETVCIYDVTSLKSDNTQVISIQSTDKENVRKTKRRGCTGCKCKKESVKINTKVAVVSLAFLISFVPSMVTQIYVNVGEHKSRSTRHQLFKYCINPLLYVIFFRNAVTPLVYLMLDSTFRGQCKALFKKTQILKRSYRYRDNQEHRDHTK